jgi:hypothetical protein
VRLHGVLLQFVGTVVSEKKSRNSSLIFEHPSTLMWTIKHTCFQHSRHYMNMAHHYLVNPVFFTGCAKSSFMASSKHSFFTGRAKSSFMGCANSSCVGFLYSLTLWVVISLLCHSKSNFTS